MTKAEGILSAPTLKSLSPTSEQLSFVSVPDMSAPGAFDDAIQGVKYVIHLAAPIPSWGEGEQNSSILEKQFISACERGAIEILEAAATKSHGTVKRVVMTSTTGGILPLPVVSGLRHHPIAQRLRLIWLRRRPRSLLQKLLSEIKNRFLTLLLSSHHGYGLVTSCRRTRKPFSAVEVMGFF